MHDIPVFLENHNFYLQDLLTNHQTACEKGNINIVKKLLDKNININVEIFKKLECNNEIYTLLQNYVVENNIKNYIKHSNYINIIKHLPSIVNKFKLKYGTTSQKIITYNLEAKTKFSSEIYEKIKVNDGVILDYLNINGPTEIYKLQEYINCLQF